MKKVGLSTLVAVVFLLTLYSKSTAQIKDYQRVPNDIDSDHYNNNCDATMSDPNEDDWSCQDDMTISHTWQSYPFGRAIGDTKKKTYTCPSYQGVQSKCKTYDDPNTVKIPIPGSGGNCAACFISLKKCGDLTKDACESSQGQSCFWYTGYKDEFPNGGECRENNGKVCNRSDGQLCNGGHCYNDQVCVDGQYCASGCPNGGSCMFQCGGYSPSTSTSTPPSTSTSTPPSSSTGSNQCEGYDNSDNAFKCFASTCGNGTSPWTTSTTNSGVYSCSGSTVGTYCCKDSTTYSNRKIQGRSGSSTGGSTGGGSSSGGNSSTNVSPTALPNRAEALACEFHGGQKNYIGSFCGSADGKTYSSFDPVKAQQKTFCGMTYLDAYECNDGTTDYFPVPGNTTCASAPWCPSGSSTSTQPSGQDKDCKAYQGQTCRPGDYSDPAYCCEPNKNLECTNPSKTGSYTCQYIGGKPFTPTPGASSTCDPANFGNWGVGCACPTGGGCGGNLRCMNEASGAVPDPTNNPQGLYCASGLWCAKSQTDVPNSAACLNSKTNTTPAGSSGSSQNLAYQADCPNINPDKSQNMCSTSNSCPQGYEQHSSEGTIGGTNGNKACSEHMGVNSICCTRIAGSSTPVVNTAPTSTPTPFNAKTAKPTGPWIPFSSIGACPVGLVGYWKGTFCDDDGTYYDVNCDSSGKAVRASTGATCTH